MPDNNIITPPTPTPTPPTPPAPPQQSPSLWAKIVTAAKQDLVDLWAQDKYFLMLFISVIMAIKFREVLINIILGSAKWLYSNTESRDISLENEISKDDSTANQIVSDANKLPDQEKPTNVNWYEDEK